MQQRDARLTFVPCGAGTSVSVLPVSLSLSNKLAVAQYAVLTSAWSCVCTSGSDVLQKLTIYCLRTIRTVFIALCISFRLILITLMIILTTCVCSLVLLQTTTFDKIERNRSIYIYTAESRHTENISICKTNSATVTHNSVER